MAVQPQTPYIEHIANGVTNSFELEFDCNDRNHLIVLVDENEPVVGDWQLDNGAVIFNSAPKNGVVVKVQRNTPFRRDRDYQSYDNSFRPPVVNKDFDWIWWKLQELGVADWILGNRINALKNYVDRKDDELKAYLLEEIRKQGVALDQLDDYYNYLMERLAQIAVDKGWDASFVVDGTETQKQINDKTIQYVSSMDALRELKPRKDGQQIYLKQHTSDNRGSGWFYWDWLDIQGDNNGTIIKKSGVVVGSWKRRYFSLKTDDFGLNLRNDDVTADLQLIDSLASEIIVNDGEYLISDFMPSKKYIFGDNAFFKTNTTSRSNGVIAQTGLKMIKPKFKHNASIAPVDGDYGNAIRIGTYRQPNDINISVHDVEIFEPEIHLTSSTVSGQGFEILGNAFDVNIIRPKIRGKGFGIICHWGGDVGDEAHDEYVTYSYHPHNIKIINPKLESTSLDLIGRMQTGVILSACYNVEVTDVETDGLSNSVYIMAGDVYAQVSVERDKYKVFTNIKVNGITVSNHVAGATPITIKGITDTRRTTTAPSSANSNDQNIRVSVKGVNIDVPRTTDTSNLIVCQYAKNIDLQANISGLVHGGAMAYFDGCVNSHFDIFGVASRGIITRSLRSCDVNIYSHKKNRTNVIEEIGVESRTLTYGGNMSGAGGAKTLTYRPNQTVIVFDGAAILKAGTVVGYVTETKEAKVGEDTVLSCTPLSNGMTFGETTNIITLLNDDLNIKGCVRGYYRNFYSTNANDISYAVVSKESHTADFVFDGTYAKNVKITSCDIAMTGIDNLSVVSSQIYIASSVKVENFNIKATFDKDKVNTNVTSKVLFDTNNYSGVDISGCSGSASISNIALNIPVSLNRQANIYMNNFSDINENILAGIVGLYIGKSYLGYTREENPPSVGNWHAGDKIYKKNVVVGQSSGWVCTVGGSTPVWTPLTVI